MSTAGLRKVGNYEEVLAQAIRDEQHVGGVINPYLANAATRIINNPEFQRVKDRLEDDLTQQTRNHMDQTADLVHEAKIHFYTVSGPVSIRAERHFTRFH